MRVFVKFLHTQLYDNRMDTLEVRDLNIFDDGPI